MTCGVLCSVVCGACGVGCLGKKNNQLQSELELGLEISETENFHPFKFFSM